MSTKHKALTLIRNKGTVTASEVAHTLKVSRAYTHRVLRMLQEEGHIQAVGNARQARYVFGSDPKQLEKARATITHTSRVFVNKDLDESLIFGDIERTTGIFLGLPKNVYTMTQFAFTEMLNNAIDHSRSKDIHIACKRTSSAIIFTIRDKGIGIFNNVRKTRRLPNTLAAIEDILKGKITTMPKRHSGEGVFFTSKAADTFIVDSFEKRLTVNNLVQDLFISDRKPPLPGTLITFTISLTSRRTLLGVFEAFTKMGDEGASFSKTRVQIKLYERGESFLSRSEAKRVVVNLEKFEEIELDFKGVETVGQAFADEIFRVWHRKHPTIRIIPTHMSPDVAFMVRRTGGV